MVGVEPTKTNLEFVILPLNYIASENYKVGNWLKVWNLGGVSTINSKAWEGNLISLLKYSIQKVFLTS